MVNTQVEGALWLELPDHLYHVLLFGKGPKKAEIWMLTRCNSSLNYEGPYPIVSVILGQALGIASLELPKDTPLPHCPQSRDLEAARPCGLLTWRQIHIGSLKIST